MGLYINQSYIMRMMHMILYKQIVYRIINILLYSTIMMSHYLYTQCIYHYPNDLFIYGDDLIINPNELLYTEISLDLPK